MYHVVQMGDKGGRSKQALLTAAVEHVVTNGVGEISLRQFATALDTSHRMLIYHFGSKDGLLAAIAREVDRTQREALSVLEADQHVPPGETLRRFWRQVSDPAMWPMERLFFELYSQALQGRPGLRPMLDGIVDSWLEVCSRPGIRRGVPVEVAVANARACVALTRGLLLDLLATGDREGVDAAMERFISEFEASL
jgi:AcrR family transcriptional regulator